MVSTEASLAKDEVCSGGAEVAIFILVGQGNCPITAGLTTKDEAAFYVM